MPPNNTIYVEEVGWLRAAWEFVKTGNPALRVVVILFLGALGFVDVADFGLDFVPGLDLASLSGVGLFAVGALVLFSKIKKLRREMNVSRQEAARRWAFAQAQAHSQR